MHSLVPAVPAGAFRNTNPSASGTCVITVPPGRTVSEDIRRFTALGVELAAAARADELAPVAAVNWGGEVKFIDAGCSDPELSRKLLYELAWGYAKLIQGPGQDLSSLARALMPLPH